MASHIRVLRAVFQRFREHNVRLRADKCKFGLTELKFLGFIVYAVQKFSTYLWATPFTLVTDAKPLKSILEPKRGLPEFTTARLHRYALTLKTWRESFFEHIDSDLAAEKAAEKGIRKDLF